MPFVPSLSTQLVSEKLVREPQEVIPQEDPTLGEIAKALGRQENMIGSWLVEPEGLPDTKDDPTFDAYSMFTKDERNDKAFVETAIFADSSDELDTVRRQIERERKDRETIARGGATSFVLALPIGLADPISLIPIGGAVANTYRAGKSILSSAAVTGSVVGVTTAVQEAALHSTQLTRTYSESAVNIGAATLLGGILGVPVQKLANYGIDDKVLSELEDVMNVEPKIAEGINPTINAKTGAVGDDSVGAARTVVGSFEVKGKAPRALLKAMPFDPLSRTSVSEYVGTRRTVNMLAENVMDVDAAPLQSAQSLAGIKIGKVYSSIDNHRKLYAQYRDKGGVVKSEKTETGTRTIYSKDEPVMTSTEFNEAVARAVRTGESDIPEVKASADFWRSELYDPLRDEMIDLNMLPEDVDVSTSVNYLNRIYNKNKISTNLPSFVSKVSKWLQNKDETLYRDAKDAQAKLDELDVEDAADVAEGAVGPTPVGSTVRAGDRGNTGKVVFADDNNVVVQFVNKKLGTTASKTFTPDQVTPVSKGAKKGGKKAADGERKKLQAIIDKAEFKKGRDFEPEDYESIALDIADRIRGTPDGRLPYDWKMGEGFSSGRNGATLRGSAALRGPLKSRKFTIEDEIIEEFLENDIETLGKRYYQQTAVDIELMRKFDSVTLDDQIKDIQQYYSQKQVATSKRKDLTDKQKEKENLRLSRKSDADIRDIAGIRDRMRGVYGYQEDNIFTRIGRSARDLNYLRLLGGVTISSLPDIARIVMAEGFAKSFTKGLIPLVTNLKQFKLVAEEGKMWGVGTDAFMGGKSSLIADVGDYVQGGTAVERGLRSGAAKFGKINVLDYWTSGAKQVHAVVMQTSIFDNLKKGIYDKRLGRLGIDEQSANDMWEQVKLYGTREGGVWQTGAKNWDRQDLERMWGVAVRKESDRVIIMPGQEKPLFMSSELGKAIGQFRAFTLSSNQRIVIAALQNQDNNTLGGVLALVTMGMFSYYIKESIAGRPVSTDPATLVMEGIDRSGVLGILGEANLTLEKISGNSVGLRPLLGVSAHASRFVSRSQAESLLGPTFGSLLSTTVAASNALTSKEPMTEADVRTLRRLIPLQNLFYLKHGFDAVEKSIVD